MSASAAARGVRGTPPAKTAFLDLPTGGNAARQFGSNVRYANKASAIGNILRQSCCTITRLSDITARRYGSKTPYFVPPSFLYKIRSGMTPHICQIAALSEITGYRFVDWMQMFSFDLHQIPLLQMQMHPESTVLITPIDFENAYHAQSRGAHSSAIQQTPSTPFTVARYCFAKIGNRDSFAAPGLIPGTIMRIDRRYRPRMDGALRNSLQNPLWLIEHHGGLTCCHIKWVEHDQVILLPTRQPLGSLPLRLSTEARILGLVDLEPGSSKPEMSPIGQSSATDESPYLETKLPGFLRAARRRTGLTFRAAHLITHAIARNLTNPDYAIGLGLLSDYEALGRLPRHIAKIISLCIMYCVDIRELLTVAGVHIDDSNKMPLPVLEHHIETEMDFCHHDEDYLTIGLGGGAPQSSRHQLNGIAGI
jgi:hypothetical protein